LSAQAIRLKGDREAEFERLRNRIGIEASDAESHFYLLKGLDESRKEYYREMVQSNTLWHLTFIAHRDAVLSHLCRLYDKDSAALSLGRFLLTVKANRDLFSDTAFRQRLKDNSHVDTLVQDRDFDDVELDEDLASVSDRDPFVSKLLALRNDAISHTAADSVRRAARQTWLAARDFEVLLSRASNITSKYSLRYRASRFGGIAGADDYKSMLLLLRRALSVGR
jgi:hypothetical protein